MPFIAVQGFGLSLLLVGLTLTERWLQRRALLTGPLRQARLLALMTGFGGLIGATAWWQNLPYAFSWPLPHLAARFLAVAGVAFGTAALRAAAISTQGHLRLIAALLAIYLGPLTLAILALHLDRFDPTAPVTYAFFAIVGLMLGLALMTLFRLAHDERGLTSGLLGLIAVLSGLWGAMLFFWPDGPLPLIWPWPQDPLTSRLIAAMFLTVAAAGFLAEGPAERRTARLLILIYGLGIVAASGAALWAGKPVSTAYPIFWGLAAALALYSQITSRAAWPKPGTSPRD